MKKIILTFILFLVLSSYLIIAENVKENEKPEKITFIHYRDGKTKIDTKPATPKANPCYKLLGAKWLSTTSYLINPNNSGLDENFVASSIFLSAEEWDKYTSKELFNNLYTIDPTANWDNNAPDFKNEYSFGLYPNSNVIAVTNLWISRIGKQKAIIEYDVLFNTYFPWGNADTDSLVMDLQNIATHETGHGAGLGDLYNVCLEETMYGYSNFGGINKRTLNTGDITGIRKLYGI